MQLTTGQKWLLGSFIAMLASLGTTFFLTGQVQTFVYVIIAVCFAFFAIMMSNSNKQKNKTDA